MTNYSNLVDQSVEPCYNHCMNATHQYLDNSPRFIIDLSKLDDFAEILHIMQSRNVTDYVYTFIFDNVVAKYGYSARPRRQLGERIYRQAGHLPGWSRKLWGSSGSDMRVICEEWEQVYGKLPNRNNSLITVVDLSNVDGRRLDSESRCKDLERWFINNHVTQFGCAPLGNKDADTKVVERRIKNQYQFDQLFES